MTKVSLIVGLVLGLVTAWMLHQYVSRLEQAQVGASFLKLKPDVRLSAGEPLQAAQLESIAIPEKFSALSKLAVRDTSDNRAWLTGRPVHKDLAPGSLLELDDFADDPAQRFSASIDADKRAMTIPVNAASAVAYFIEPGSKVDLVGTLRLDLDEDLTVPIPENIRKNVGSASERLAQLRSRTVAKTILQNVKVLAVGKATTRGSYLGSAQEGYKTITIEVTPLEAEKLIFAQSQLQGGLFVLLRNPENNQETELPVVNWKDLN